MRQGEDVYSLLVKQEGGSLTLFWVVAPKSHERNQCTVPPQIKFSKKQLTNKKFCVILKLISF